MPLLVGERVIEVVQEDAVGRRVSHRLVLAVALLEDKDGPDRHGQGVVDSRVDVQRKWALKKCVAARSFEPRRTAERRTRQGIKSAATSSPILKSVLFPCLSKRPVRVLHSTFMPT